MTTKPEHRLDPSTDDLPTESDMFRQIRVTAETAWQNRLSRAQVEQWLANFTGDVFSAAYERQLALWLLCNFVFYNQSEVRHLCRTAFRQFLHLALTCLPSAEDRDWDEAVNGLLDNVRFYHLGRPGESGAFILYYFRQENNLGVRSFLTQPDRLPKNVDTIAFVDDVVLSGGQATRYLDRATAGYDADKRKILLTFLSTEEAEDILQKADITVISCIKLSDRSRCFSADSTMFVNHPTHRERCRTFAEAYGAKIDPENPLGFDGGQYAFGFYYNTPNNTLPIFWSETGGWTPIMKRYDKIYGKGGPNELGRFI